MRIIGITAKTFVSLASLLAMLTALTALGYDEGATVYTLDQAHSRIGFSVGHLGISTVSGHFRNYAGTLKHVPGESGFLEAKATIDVATIDTGVEARDRHLRSEDFFLVDDFPEITYEARAVEKRDDKWLLTGTFSMRGVARELTIPVTIAGPIEDPWGNQRIALKGEIAIDRKDFNIGSDKISDRLVGREVTIELTIQGVAGSED